MGNFCKPSRIKQLFILKELDLDSFTEIYDIPEVIAHERPTRDPYKFVPKCLSSHHFSTYLCPLFSASSESLLHLRTMAFLA